MMSSSVAPSFLQGYWQDAFNLKQHLQEFLNLDLETIEKELALGQQSLKEIGHRDFDWEKATEFYRDRVGQAYLFELGAWHLSSQDYIGGTLTLISDLAVGRVLDFGGGIGTHAIAAALCPQVEQVVYCDLNPINCNFVQSRAAKLGLSNKISCCLEVSPTEVFDTIISLDVMEHLLNPSQQLMEFHKMLTPSGKIILNWYFFKGFNQEFPFHLEDEAEINRFFYQLQSQFIEVFHPHLITARCYRKLTPCLEIQD
jgi:2-polyprenyl-3-methyl-5-hydroxy-6-metoxy-1,4-benzoquinol methylase